MKKELKIIAPDGYEIDKDESSFENIVFKKIRKIFEWNDFGRVKGFFISDDCQVIGCCATSDYINKNIFPTEDEAEACLALSQLCQWRDRVNSDWKPDWTAPYQNKYVIYYENEIIKTGFSKHARFLLSFKSEEIRNQFIDDFRELIEIAKPLL